MKIRFTNRTTLSMAALLSRLSWHFGPNGAAFAQLQEDTYAGVSDYVLHVTFIIKLPCMGLLEITAGAFGENTEARTASAVTTEWEGPDRLEQLGFSFAFAGKGKHPEEEDRNDPIPAALPKEEKPAWKSAANTMGVHANGNFPPEGFFTVRVPFLFTQIMKE